LQPDLNLLVTSAHAPQAYATIRALRPLARRVVVAGYPVKALLGRLPHAAYSRFVDKRYSVPSPVDDWQAGRIQRANSEAEEAYVTAMLGICEREGITAVFPCWDPDVYVLSKNRERFARLGVLVPVPDFDITLAALDKYRTVEAALAVGFPCPRTYLCENDADARRIAAEEGFPLVIKPRFTSGARGMHVVRDEGELLGRLDFARDGRHRPMLQEFIPGGRKQSLQFLVDRKGQLCFAFHKRRVRNFRVNARFGTVSESAPLPPYCGKVAELVKKMNWWGGGGVEVLQDPRDGAFKLMEMNARFARQLWNRTELGINEPQACLEIARGHACPPLPDYPLGVLFVSPYEDLLLCGLQLADLAAWRLRGLLGGTPPGDASNAPLPLRELLPGFFSTYRRGRTRVLDPCFRHFFQDPVVSLIWWLQFGTWVAGACRQLGR
jgi:biotin carboxylase